MSSQTLRDQIAVAIHAVQHADNPIVAIAEATDPRHRVGACYRCIDSADAVLAVVEAHVTQKQAEELRVRAHELAQMLPASWDVTDAVAQAVRRLTHRADELDPRPEEATG